MKKVDPALFTYQKWQRTSLLVSHSLQDYLELKSLSWEFKSDPMHPPQLGCIVHLHKFINTDTVAINKQEIVNCSQLDRLVAYQK
jgi:hypothetical protein